MVAITSHRPLDKCTPQIKANQLRAHKSWLTAFERVVYLGEPCLELCAISCEFVSAPDRPPIQQLCKVAAQMGTWVCLINSDIVVPKDMMQLQARMDQAGVKCAITRRYDLESGFIVDWGLDMFMGTQEVWKKAYGMVPPDFTIGRAQWDSWMLSFMVGEFGRKCADVTRERVCYHPNHGDRLDPNWQGKGLSHRYATVHHWPSTILR